MSVPKRPVLRYHGGKWRLAPWILSHFPKHRIYCEPFGGGASVLLRKARSYAEIYNDLDSEIVNVFRVLREPTSAAELDRLLRLTPYARDEFRESYEPSSSVVEQARRTIVRSYMGFASATASGKQSGFRARSDQSGTSPATDWNNYREMVPLFTSRLAGVCIENRSAFDLIPASDHPEALFYVDPPYPHGTRNFHSASNGQYRHELLDDEHRQLAAILRSTKGAVILSGYACEMYDVELYADWHRVQRDSTGEMAGKKRIEVLWLNPSASSRLAQNTLDLGAA